jgi:hypothetical protein
MSRAEQIRDAWENILPEPRIAAAGGTPPRQQSHPLATDAAAALIRDCLGPVAADPARMIVVRDADETLLWIDEPSGGRLDPELLEEWRCSAAPVHDPEIGRAVGSIGVTGEPNPTDAYVAGCVAATARAVEYHLRSLMHERDVRLCARYGDRIAGPGPRASLVTPRAQVISGNDAVTWIGAARSAVRPGAAERATPGARPLLRLALLTGSQPRVEIDGRRLPLSPIRTELLALLSARPGGMTSEELAADLYGDSGQPGSVRVHIFRLRQVLGPWIDTGPYRLLMDVESDVVRVRRLLERGAVREAAQHYDGPLLPHSEAPGVVRERQALEGWLRQAVMTADDVEALWAWTQSASGCDDLPAWKRLLASVDYRDPRRSLAASRVRSLRDAHQ